MLKDDKPLIDAIEIALDLGQWEKRAADFWHRDEKWPVDGPGWIFIGRALNQIGKARYGEAWTGRELFERFVPFLDDPSALLGVSYHAEYAIGILHAADVPNELDGPCLSRREAQLAVDLFTKYLKSGRVASAERIAAVQNVCLSALAQHRLRSATRAMQGRGGFEELPWEVWNSDDAPARFIMGLIDPKDPEARWNETPDATKALLDHPAMRNLWPSYLFILAADIERIVAVLAKSRTDDEATSASVLRRAGASEAHLRKVCRDILQRWVDGGKKPEERPTVRSVEAEVRNLLPSATRDPIRRIWEEVRSTIQVDWSDKGRRP